MSAIDPKSGSTTSLAKQIGGMAKQFLFSGAVLFCILAVVAVLWRFLDLYEASVKSQTVHARIAMERHQFWMEEMKALKARENSLSPEKAKALLQEQMKTVPASGNQGP